jgi:transcriptional regulator with XRE-family HTH domain
MDADIELFGKALRQLRGAKTVREVAFPSGVSVETWERWENGEQRPSLQQVSKALVNLGATTEDLVNALLQVASPPGEPSEQDEHDSQAKLQRSLVNLLARVQELLVESSHQLAIPPPQTPWPGLRYGRTDDDELAVLMAFVNMVSFLNSLVQVRPRYRQEIELVREEFQRLREIVFKESATDKSATDDPQPTTPTQES